MLVQKTKIASDIYWQESENEGQVIAAYDARETDEDGRVVDYVQNIEMPRAWQDEFVELKELTFVIFKKVKVLVAIGTHFYPSEQYKALPWWKRLVIRIELLWLGIQ
ncbi:MAG: hypothetical protein AAGI23_09305 [Bacteroidota bacterium]